MRLRTAAAPPRPVTSSKGPLTMRTACLQSWRRFWTRGRQGTAARSPNAQGHGAARACRHPPWSGAQVSDPIRAKSRRGHGARVPSSDQACVRHCGRPLRIRGSATCGGAGGRDGPGLASPSPRRCGGRRFGRTDGGNAAAGAGAAPALRCRSCGREFAMA